MKALISFVVASLIASGAGSECRAQTEAEPGLLFHLSGERGVVADTSRGGTPEPTFVRDVEVIADGAQGKGLQCAGTQLLAYRAPGNIYAERGTLAFYWRSRDPVGPTPFPVFRVGYADHSSWDMVWLRLDYNGRRGFDAFVTDANLSRVRVSAALPKFPAPSAWVHLAFAWDETRGVRLYVNGKKVAGKDQTAALDAGLDQFGPHSRVISPMQVQSDYNFIRGGDIDELRIYDRMLSDTNVADLAAGRAPSDLASGERSLAQRRQRDAWWLRHGWNRPADVPPYLAAPSTRVRKVEIHEVFDLKRWWWKATDGIRETTWPGVYNRSRLPGRNDYFQLPDWDCYSLSGKSVSFTLPNEPWNHVEISGAAWGAFHASGDAGKVLFRRPKGQEKTVHRLPEARTGQTLRFDSAEQEQPLGELSVFHVSDGAEPGGRQALRYVLGGETAPSAPGESLAGLVAFIAGRHAADERTTLFAQPLAAASSTPASPPARSAAPVKEPRSAARHSALPHFHVLIPAERWAKIDGGLDGIAIDLPPLDVAPTHGAHFPLELQIKDPLWPARNLLELSFSVKPGEARTLWLDTRNRILPAGKPLYLTLTGAGRDLDAASLSGMELRLLFMPRKDALAEHELDRFTQARDSYAMLSEERPRDPRFDLYNRFAADIQDLLRVSPKHWLGQAYWYDHDNSQPKPPWKPPAPPADVPLWAHRQVELLSALKRLVLWYIDHRQIENGEFGGGLSDDGDLTNLWPGTALMGAEPDKIRASLARELEAYYAQGLMTNGLSTIQTDELHAYEEGIAVLSQLMMLDYGNPKLIERAMETARALRTLTALNRAGHRHLRSSYFSGTRLAEEEPWGGSREYSYLLTHVVLLLVDYNGIPEARRLVLELADGLLAHRRAEGGHFRLHPSVRFETDADAVTRPDTVYPLLWAAYRFSGDAKYLLPLRDEGARILELIPTRAPPALGLSPSARGFSREAQLPRDGLLHVAWEATGDTRFLEELYAAQTEAAALREYINTEGSLWIDRVGIPSREGEPHRLNGGRELQRARLGGVALIRNWYFPGHAVSWRFRAPANEQSVALLVPNATPRSLKVVGYNLTRAAVGASMTTWGLEPGRWELQSSVEGGGQNAPPSTRTVDVERGGALDVVFAPRATTVLELKLLAPGSPARARPDLALGADDIAVSARGLRVTVHNIGGAEAPASEVALIDADGRVRASAPIAALAAPHDLLPKTRTVTLPLRGPRAGQSVVLDPGERIEEISEGNNRVEL